MTDPRLFWVIFSAVFLALLMAGTFLWGAVTYTRMERAGAEHTKKGNGVFLAILMPLLIGGFSCYIAFGGN